MFGENVNEWCFLVCAGQASYNLESLEWGKVEALQWVLLVWWIEDWKMVPASFQMTEQVQVKWHHIQHSINLLLCSMEQVITWKMSRK